MADAIKEVLQREVEATLEQAAKQREAMRHRVSAACDRIRRRQVLTRAETLTPVFRTDFLRRGKLILRIRARLLQTLSRYAHVLHSGDLRAAYGLSNLEMVLRAVREAVVEEAELTQWQLPLPREEEWRGVCVAVQESCNRKNNSSNGGIGNLNHSKNTTASIVLSSEQKEQEPLETALIRFLSPCHGNNDNEEAPMGADSLMPWLSVPCFCSLAYYCRQTQLLLVATKDISRKDVSRREDDDETTEVEKATMGDADIALSIFQAAAEHLRQLSGSTGETDDDVMEVNNNNSNNNNNNNNNNGIGHESNDESDEAIEAAMEEVRLRVCIEIAARATACKYAVESLSTGEDAILFDGLATVMARMMMTSSAPQAEASHILPFTTLVLPPMEQLFFCIAYTIGAAILRDEYNERCTGGAAIVVICDEEEACRDDAGTSDNGGWRSVFERWMLQERSATNMNVAFLGLRLLQYLFEYVFHPAPRGVHMGKPAEAVEVPPEIARRWLRLAVTDTADKESVVELMMSSFLNRSK